MDLARTRGREAKAKPAAPAAPVAPGVASAMPAASTIKRGPMHGLMQDWKLTVDKVIEHAHQNHGHREIVTRTVEGPIVRSTYSDLYWRARQCSNALLADGVQKGDRDRDAGLEHRRATWRCWYGTMCIGAVLHTLNPRLFPEQIAWIINHAEDTHVFFDITFQPIVEAIKDKVPTREALDRADRRAHMPQIGDAEPAHLRGLHRRPVDGRACGATSTRSTACGLCYTSGTTGDPKGVLYSHRSNILHTHDRACRPTRSASARATRCCRSCRCSTPTPGASRSRAAVGAKLVLPGAKMDGESIYELLEGEKVTFTAAVPTVWLMLLQHLEATGKKLPHLKRVVIGGSAVPGAILRAFEEDYDVEVIHAWGMTEMSPIGTLGSMPEHVLTQDHDSRS